MEINEHLRGKYHGMAYSFEKDTQKRLFAYFLLFTGLLIFILSLLGTFDDFSKWTNNFLVDNLGYTNRWSKSFGPKWFLYTMTEISALGGKVMLFISSVLVVIYYKLNRKQILLWKFLFVFVGGNFVLLALKLIFTKNIPYEPFDFLISDVTPFPSGHAMMSLIFYLTIAVLLTRRQRKRKVRNFTLISASVIVFIICISRVLRGSHTVTEVLGGFSTGLIWLCLCWLAERYLRIHYKWDF